MKGSEEEETEVRREGGREWKEQKRRWRGGQVTQYFLFQKDTVINSFKNIECVCVIETSLLPL